MTTDMPINPASKSRKRKKADSSIPRWSVFSLCFITTLIVVSLIKAYLPLLVSAVAMLFIWSQITKPIAEIESKPTNDDSNQLNLFRHYSQFHQCLLQLENFFQV